MDCLRIITLLAVFIVNAIAQPVIAPGGILNNASYARPGLLNGTVAQGSVAAIFGQSLGPNVSPALQVSSFPLGASLGGVSVQVTSGNSAFNALPLYVSAGQVGVIIPSATPTGNATVTVSYQGQTSAPVAVIVVKRNFGIFTLNQAGTGPAIIQNFNSQSDQPLNTLIAPAQPGQVITIWGTGLGPVSGDESSGPLPGDLNIPVSVYFGNTSAHVSYAGRSGCCAGIDQLSVTVPSGLTGCYVPITVVAGTSNSNPTIIQNEGTTGNYATIAISSDGSVCSDPTGLSGSDIQQMRQNNSYRVASISLARTYLFNSNLSTMDSGTAIFGKYDAAALLASRGIFGWPAVGTCIGLPVQQDASFAPDPIQPAALDGGSAINVVGPSGSRQLTRQSSGQYTANLGGNTQSTGYLVPGNYTVDNGSGGADVGPFQASFTVPPPITWTNKSALLSPHGSADTLYWTGGDPNSFTVIVSPTANSVTGYVRVCTQRTSAGFMDLPDAFITGNTGTGINGMFGAEPFAVYIGTLSAPVRFTASGLDVGLISTLVLSDGVYRQ